MMEPEYILTQDIGGFSCKATLFSLDGTLVRSNVVTYQSYQNDKGWYWQSPHLWWDAFCQNCKTLLAGIPPEAVKVVSICGQMMACLPVDQNVHPLYDCITWNDTRAIEQAAELQRSIGAGKLHEITGVGPGYAFTLPKIMWMKKYCPELYKNTYKFIQSKDYINYLLTGQLVTDETDAGFTQIYDLYHRAWSNTILEATDIDGSKLPAVVPLGTILGHVTAKAAEQCGLSTSTLVAQGLGDGRAPTLGAGVQKPGEGCLCISSSAWLSQVTQEQTIDPNHAITKAAYIAPDLFVNGGSMLSGLLSVDWYMDTFFPELDKRCSLDQFFANQLSNSPVGSNGLLFLPHLRGERAPRWNNFAKSGFVGLSSKHTRYDFTRSILEGISFQLGTIKNYIEKLEPFVSMQMVGAGCSPLWQQMFSDIFEMDIISSDVTWDAACVGVAVVAGVAAGIYKDYSEVSRFHHKQIITTPIQENVEIYRELLPTFEDCYFALEDINQHLGGFAKK